MSRIYINSRGFEQNLDYCWIEVLEGSQTGVSSLPMPFENDVENLVYFESSSVLLSRKNNKLFLLLSSIEPEGRVDFTQIRQIAISVAWVIDDSKDNESILRMIAAQALDEDGWATITLSIAQAVTLGGEYGFQGNFNLLNNILDFNKAKELVTNNPLTDYGQTTHRLAKLSPTMKSTLAKELLTFKLPRTSDSEDMVLVVVTEIKKEKNLMDALVWRGLSNLVSHEVWWTYYPLAKPFGDLLWFTITVATRINRSWGINFRAILERVLRNKDI